eukprot:350415-Chlamydomonas_euryale.AAC.3
MATCLAGLYGGACQHACVNKALGPALTWYASGAATSPPHATKCSLAYATRPGLVSTSDAKRSAS